MLTRDFFLYVRGKDYFRQKQGLGGYFTDERCYYNDLTGKTRWAGMTIDGLPVYRFAEAGDYVHVPIMLLNFGLGSIDCFFLGSGSYHLKNVIRVAEWLISNVEADGSFNNRLSERDRDHRYLSHSSCIVQGEALSFIYRCVRFELVDKDLQLKLVSLADRVYENMILPVGAGGCMLKDDHGDPIFCEFSDDAGSVVLNGWIFAAFGILDYIRLTGNAEAQGVYERTLAALKRLLPDYHLPSGWAYYDNQKRKCSPFYQELHANLLEALARLTGDDVFSCYAQRARHALIIPLRAQYTLSKCLEKARDKMAYGGQA